MTGTTKKVAAKRAAKKTTKKTVKAKPVGHLPEDSPSPMAGGGDPVAFDTEATLRDLLCRIQAIEDRLGIRPYATGEKLG